MEYLLLSGSTPIGCHMSLDDAGGPAVPTEEMIVLLYRELHALATAWITRERASHTLTATAVVHEAYLRLARPGITWPNRALFFSAAAEAMRRILIEHARRKNAAKRGGADGSSLRLIPGGRSNTRAEVGRWADDVKAKSPAVGVLELSAALERLKIVDPLAHQVVMLRYFAGLTEVQTADLIGRSERQTRRIWVGAKAWLHEWIEQDR